MICGLEHDLWDTYEEGGSIPLFIDLKALDNADKDMIHQHLHGLYLFSDAQLEELRHSRDFILIYDGYDEQRKWSNLHTRNNFNTPYQWKVKMIVTCRTQYLNPNYCT